MNPRVQFKSYEEWLSHMQEREAQVLEMCAAAKQSPPEPVEFFNPADGELHSLRLPTPFLDYYGREVNNPKVLAPPVGFVKQPSIMERIAEQRSLQALARHEEWRDLDETFEEGDDFEVEDDILDPTTPWEFAGDAQARAEILATVDADIRNFLETRSQSNVAPGAAPSPDKGARPGGPLAPGERSKKSADEAEEE